MLDIFVVGESMKKVKSIMDHIAYTEDVKKRTQRNIITEDGTIYKAVDINNKTMLDGMRADQVITTGIYFNNIMSGLIINKWLYSSCVPKDFQIINYDI